MDWHQTTVLHKVIKQAIELRCRIKNVIIVKKIQIYIYINSTTYHKVQKHAPSETTLKKLPAKEARYVDIGQYRLMV